MHRIHILCLHPKFSYCILFLFFLHQFELLMFKPVPFITWWCKIMPPNSKKCLLCAPCLHMLIQFALTLIVVGRKVSLVIVLSFNCPFICSSMLFYIYKGNEEPETREKSWQVLWALFRFQKWYQDLTHHNWRYDFLFILVLVI